MAEALEPRVVKLEKSFDEYIAMFYTWLDELRSFTLQLRKDHEESRKRIEENEVRMKQNEEGLQDTKEMMRALVVLHGDTLKLLTAVNSRMNGLEDKMNG